MSDEAILHSKLNRLRLDLRRPVRFLLAYSGGVDSSFLLAMLKEVGSDFLAVTAVSPTMPASDRNQALQLAQTLGVAHRIIESGEMANPLFVKNDADRCFHCKDDLFTRLLALAHAEGYDQVMDGSTADDASDYRPGMRAKTLHGVHSPLMAAGLTKEELRLESQRMGLPTWDRPASPCLSSRISYGEPIDLTALNMVEEAEKWFKTQGFPVVRVRKQHLTARIEVPEAEITRFIDPDLRLRTIHTLRQLGFQFVSLDLEGFASGRLNRLVMQ
ncbi:MAG: ATP-dependent sacrificial sulfur transferase LarE [Magnetococcales bacterium]|nr:ATP-dependent sacrificial sulfur transferase LarE [Magnetococcales bacterium]